MTQRRLVIVGAGPIGLEAALRAVRDGFDVTVLEKGRTGEAMRNWPGVRLFTPFRMNSSADGRRNVSADIGDDEIHTARRFADSYLVPLSRCNALRGRVLEGHEVIAVSRDACGKSDRIGRPDRADRPFRILVRTADGERVLPADIVMDCTGFTARHRFIGTGGIPCPGELQLLSDAHYRLPDIVGADESRFAGRHTLVIGSGYTAATSILLLHDLGNQHGNTRVTWITRGGRKNPVVEIPDDPLPERGLLSRTVNRIAAECDFVTLLPGPEIEAIEKLSSGYRVRLSWSDGHERGRADYVDANELIANVGYRPDGMPFDELQIHRCYATEGPIRLAAHLLGETSGDCLEQSAAGPDLLRNPEPDFYILGSASYGRDNRFLLQIGLQQIDDLFSMLAATTEAAV